MRRNPDLNAIWKAVRLLPHHVNHILEFLVRLLSYFVNLHELFVKL